MIGTERQNEILEYIKLHETINTQQIVKTFFVSEATARRDLSALEKTGLIRRVFGGATLNLSGDKQVPLFTREREDENEKAALCKKAAKYLKDGCIIFIDASSTVQFLIPYLTKYKDIIVITNGIKTAEALSSTDVKVYFTGGLLIKNSYSFIGHDAEQFAEKFNADICFISCKGLSEDGILSDTSYEETELRKVYINHSRTKIALITSSKIGKKYIHTLCNVKDLDCVIHGNDIALSNQ